MLLPNSAPLARVVPFDGSVPQKSITMLNHLMLNHAHTAIVGYSHSIQLSKNLCHLVGGNNRVVHSSCASMPLRLPKFRRATDTLVGSSGVDLTTRHTRAVRQADIDCCKCPCEFVTRVRVLVHRGSDTSSRADRIVTVTVLTECPPAFRFCSKC